MAGAQQHVQRRLGGAARRGDLAAQLRGLLALLCASKAPAAPVMVELRAPARAASSGRQAGGDARALQGLDEGVEIGRRLSRRTPVAACIWSSSKKAPPTAPRGLNEGARARLSGGGDVGGEEHAGRPLADGRRGRGHDAQAIGAAAERLGDVPGGLHAGGSIETITASSLKATWRYSPGRLAPDLRLDAEHHGLGAWRGPRRVD